MADVKVKNYRQSKTPSPATGVLKVFSDADFSGDTGDRK